MIKNTSNIEKCQPVSLYHNQFALGSQVQKLAGPLCFRSVRFLHSLKRHARNFIDDLTPRILTLPFFQEKNISPLVFTRLEILFVSKVCASVNLRNGGTLLPYGG